MIIIGVPNSKLITLPWKEVESEVNKSKSADTRMYDWKNIAKSLGQINRFHNKALTDAEFLELQRRMTRVRAKFQQKNAKARLQGKEDPYPVLVVDGWFSGVEKA